MNQTESAAKSVGAAHTLLLENRETLRLSGVEEVVSFDDRAVVLATALGMLSVDGSDLRVRHLDTERGDVLIQGKICGVVYVDSPAVQGKQTRRGRGLFG